MKKIFGFSSSPWISTSFKLTFDPAADFASLAEGEAEPSSARGIAGKLTERKMDVKIIRRGQSDTLVRRMRFLSDLADPTRHERLIGRMCSQILVIALDRLFRGAKVELVQDPQVGPRGAVRRGDLHGLAELRLGTLEIPAAHEQHPRCVRDRGVGAVGFRGRGDQRGGPVRLSGGDGR